MSEVMMQPITDTEVSKQEYLYTAQKEQKWLCATALHKPKSVYKSLLNCTSEISLSRNATDREFQKHGPATEKLLSPRRVRVLFVAHVKTSADADVGQELTVFSQVLWKLAV